jgi:hypothetical protein
MATQSSSSGIGGSTKARAKILMMPHVEPHFTSFSPPPAPWVSSWRRNHLQPRAWIQARWLRQRVRLFWKAALITVVFWLALSWLALRVLLGRL